MNILFFDPGSTSGIDGYINYKMSGGGSGGNGGGSGSGCFKWVVIIFIVFYVIVKLFGN